MLQFILNAVVYTVGGIPLTICGLIAIIAFKKKRNSRAKANKLHNEVGVEDVVYLCQFPPVPSVKSISPFALKVDIALDDDNQSQVTLG